MRVCACIIIRAKAARDVGEAIIDMLYPGGADGRIPIISITGTNGKTTVTRMIGHVLHNSGATVGMTTTDGIWASSASANSTRCRASPSLLSATTAERLWAKFALRFN